MKHNKNKLPNILTSEQVGMGHPDKVCDQVADYILDYFLSLDKKAKVAIEATIGKGKLFITGEITYHSKGKKVDITKLKKSILKDVLVSIDPSYKTFKIEWNVGQQSVEINSIVEKEDGEIGAGDQGLMYGYATRENIWYLATAHALSSFISKRYDQLRHSNKDFGNKFKADSKSQVSYDYENKRIININLSAQHNKNLKVEDVRMILRNKIIAWVHEYEKINKIKFNTDYEITINNFGAFTIGGAIADAGTVGRKIIADTYGGFGRHGGGAFSGKDYTKVDRSAAYYARYIAKNIVAHNLSDIAEVQLSYIIGSPRPITLNIETFDTEKKDKKYIETWVAKHFDASVKNIIEELSLKNVKYSKSTLYGHFFDSTQPWEKIIK